MTPARRSLLTLLGVAIVSIFLSTLATAGALVLQNDNGDISWGSRTGRLSGDIDAAVFTPDDHLFPVTIQSVQFAFHRPQAEPAPWIGDSARVRVQVYAIQDGVVGDILAESEPRTLSALDTWLSVSLTSPVLLEEPASFMAAVKWESGSEAETALPLALDSNFSAPQSEKNAMNLFHREDIWAPDECQVGFCTHEELGLRNTEGQPAGFNMIRVRIDSPAVTPTPTTTVKPTRTPTPSPTPTTPPHTIPDNPVLYLPVVLRNHNASVQSVRIGGTPDEAGSYSLTSGTSMRNKCWRGEENNLWVGREADDERGIMRSVVRFELSRVPAEATIVAASLQLVAVETGAGPEPLLPLFVHNVTKPWPACPTWNTLGSAVGSSWASIAVGPAVSVYTIDVTDLVKSWLSGALPNYGFMLRSEEDLREFRGFVPTASSQEDLRPRLVIRYRVP